MRRWMYGCLALVALGCTDDKDRTDPDSGTDPVDTTPTGDTALVCDPGYADCNADPGDGCEASLLERLTCGSCDEVCGVGQRCGDAGCVDLEVTSPLRTGVPTSTVNFDADGFV